ncbi:ABC transporter permease [Candidatus Aerophobetes bacterium]|uniref:ABC transporter permease n=1 Tax=Aerophobetes bacterium TaxID=2030807 RepID=A0A523RP82_UNCAE|nr:MAG: ABC transporter permease [Candidatus Aerophobetes bacterium]
MIEQKDKKDKMKEKKLFVASQWQLIRWKFFSHKLAVGALGVLSVFYLCVIFAEFICPYDPYNYSSRYMYHPPQRIHFFDEEEGFHFRPFVYGTERGMDMTTYEITYIEDKTKKHSLYFFVKGDPYKLWGLFLSNIHLFGTEEERVFLFGADKIGRDMFSRTIYGGRISLSIGLVGIAITFILGVIIGGISGYHGGIADRIIQRIIEFIRSIPTLPLWMALSVALPPDWPIVKVYFGIVIILSLVGWTGLARVVRGKFMSLKEEEFVMAAKLHGASEPRLLFKHLLPSFYSYIIASLTLSVPRMILGETALSFLGLGMQAPAISWGVLLRDAQMITVLSEASWLLIPGVFVIIAILAFNFLGDGLRDAADPYTTI